jgi:flagellar basal-body rod modification protein FlgD
MNSDQAVQAASIVGHHVLAPGNTGVLGTSGKLDGALDLTQSGGADNVVVNIVDSSGATVQTLNLGTQPSGLAQFSWDGTTASGARAPAGSYTIQALGTVAGQQQALTPLVSANVDSVTLNGANGLVLNLAGLGPVNFNQVRQIFAGS